MSWETAVFIASAGQEEFARLLALVIAFLNRDRVKDRFSEGRLPRVW